MESRIFSGNLRSRVTLQQPVLTPDTQGGQARSWQDVADLWAEIQPLSGREISSERFVNQQMEARITHRVTLRFRAGISTDMRLLYEGRALYIRAVINREERGVALEILAEEGTGA